MIGGHKVGEDTVDASEYREEEKAEGSMLVVGGELGEGAVEETGS